jgi:hypothetical protein
MGAIASDETVTVLKVRARDCVAILPKFAAVPYKDSFNRP